MATRPIAEGIFTETPQLRLLAGRCQDCETVTFPKPSGCPRCTGREIHEHVLQESGVLWSWTIQHFLPKKPYRGPEDFVAFGVGYVEFPGECIVEGRLTTADPAQLSIGAPMTLTLIENHRDEEGNPVMTYAFAPVQEEVQS